MGTDVILDKLFEYKDKYGHVFLLTALNRRMLHISDSKLCREVLLKRPKLLKRGTPLEGMAKTLGYLPFGLFHATDAQIWGKVKKLTAPAFSKQNLLSMSTILYEESMVLVTKLQCFAKSGTEVDMMKEANGLTVGVISKVAFGDEHVEYFFGKQFYDDVNLTFKVILEAALFPFPHWMWRLTPMYKGELGALQANERFSTACQEVVDRKRRQHATMSEATKKELHGLIDIMIRQEGTQDEEILANVKTFYLAGSDTTSVSISWAMYLLSQHAEVVVRLRKEVDSFFAMQLDSKSAQEIGEAIAGLTFTTAVFKEVIRLYPVAPLIFLDFADTSEAMELSNGMVVGTDTTLQLNLWTCLLDEDYFPQAKKFDPARWLTDDKARLGLMDTAFMGFGGGTRACPGMGLAMAEGAMAIAALVHYFDFELACPLHEVKVDYKFTMQPNKLPMRLTNRVVA